ncbi:hypothetical protein [Pseudomonas fluorescens]|nr:hypothetical protein [Pseudomonas fluorescens]
MRTFHAPSCSQAGTERHIQRTALAHPVDVLTRTAIIRDKVSRGVRPATAHNGRATHHNTAIVVPVISTEPSRKAHTRTLQTSLRRSTQWPASRQRLLKTS